MYNGGGKQRGSNRTSRSIRFFGGTRCSVVWTEYRVIYEMTVSLSSIYVCVTESKPHSKVTVNDRIDRRNLGFEQVDCGRF